MLAFFIWEKRIFMLFLKQLDLPLAARYSLSVTYDVIIALLCLMMNKQLTSCRVPNKKRKV